jgi:hypothetical protein
MDEETKAEATALLITARQHLKAAGITSPTLQVLVQAATTLAAESGSRLTEQDIGRAAVLLAAARPGGRGQKIRDAAKHVAETQAADWVKATVVKDDPQLDALLHSIFSRLREEFRDETLDGSAVLETIGTQLHSLTGGHMTAFMERMRDAFPKVITHQMVLNWLGRHFRSTRGSKRLPRLSDKVPGTQRFKAGYPLTWGEVERALLRGEYGLPGKECLAELIHRHLGFTCECHRALNPTKVHVNDGPTPILIEHHVRRTGTFPRPGEEVIAHTDLTWSMLHEAARDFLGSIRLELPPGREDLALAYYYLNENIVDILSNWIARTGQVPDSNSGNIPDAGGLTWGDAERYIRRHNLAYLKRCSSSGEVLKWTDATLLQLSESESLRTFWIQINVYKWCNRWVRSTGLPPTPDSGLVPESGGIRWSEIDDYLRLSHRMAYPNGLPKAVLSNPGYFYPYMCSSLEDRIAHFEVVRRARGTATDGDFGPAA